MAAIRIPAAVDYIFSRAKNRSTYTKTQSNLLSPVKDMCFEMFFYLEIVQYYTMTLQRPRINEGDAGFEPGTSASEVWRATNEPPHLTDPTHVTPYYMDPKQVMEI